LTQWTQYCTVVADFTQQNATTPCPNIVTLAVVDIFYVKKSDVDF